MMKNTLLLVLKKKKKYIIVGFAFVTWMLFFDDKNVFVQHNLSKQIEELESNYALYLQKLEDVEEELKALEKHPEKYAREKYYMHKSDEEVFIIGK